ncbi:MAG TPA: hypothetical protein VIG33_16910 [Pseudobdellovibrionaceae bacterium]|jgi:hypothetical protein
MYIDAYAIIVQKDMDGGDSLHREGMYAFGKKLTGNLSYNHFKNEFYITDPLPLRGPAAENILDRFEVSPGIYVRHPDPKKWYSNPDTTSRDQLMPVIAYCAAYEDYPRLWRLFKAVAQRGLFAQNTIRNGEGEIDKKIPDPMHLNLAQFIRAGGWWTAPFYPLLFAFDSVELIGTVLTTLPLHFQDDHLLPRWRNDNDVDDNNVVVQHLLAAQYKPTPLSELSRYIYSISRTKNLGNTLLGEENAVMGALRWYHRNELGGEGNPEIAELYRPLIEKYFNYQTPQEYVIEHVAEYIARIEGKFTEERLAFGQPLSR